MSDLFGNHIVGFPTRRLNYAGINLSCSCCRPECHPSALQDPVNFLFISNLFNHQKKDFKCLEIAEVGLYFTCYMYL